MPLMQLRIAYRLYSAFMLSYHVVVLLGLLRCIAFVV